MGALAAQNPVPPQAGGRHVIAYAGVVAPPDLPSRRHEPPGEQGVLPARGAEGLVEPQVVPPHDVEVEQEVVGRGDGPHGARRPGAPLEEGARAHPRIGFDVIGRHDEPGHGSGRRGVEDGQQRCEPARLGLLVVVDEDQQPAASGLIQSPVAHRGDAGARLDLVPQAHPVGSLCAQRGHDRARRGRGIVVDHEHLDGVEGLRSDLRGLSQHPAHGARHGIGPAVGRNGDRQAPREDRATGTRPAGSTGATGSAGAGRPAGAAGTVVRVRDAGTARRGHEASFARPYSSTRPPKAPTTMPRPPRHDTSCTARAASSPRPRATTARAPSRPARASPLRA